MVEIILAKYNNNGCCYHSGLHASLMVKKDVGKNKRGKGRKKKTA
jgi:hypothetical protein